MDPGVRRESFPAVPGTTVAFFNIPLNAGAAKTFN
jgi:hypothetical protein